MCPVLELVPPCQESMQSVSLLEDLLYLSRDINKLLFAAKSFSRVIQEAALKSYAHQNLRNSSKDFFKTISCQKWELVD